MFSVRRSECGVVTGVAQVRAPFLSCMRAALRVGEVRHCGGLLSRSVTMYRVKLEAVGSNCYSAVRGVWYSRVRCHCRWSSPTSARPLSTKQYHCLVECSVFQFDQVDLSHRCRFSCHGMSSVSMLQCPGSTDTL